MSLIVKNPFSEPIHKIIFKIECLNWKFNNLFPSIIEFCVLSIALIIFIIIWPYGFILIIATFILDLIKETIKEIKGKTIEQSVPFILSVGVYFSIYLMLFTICFPFYAIGYLGKRFFDKY